jgi:hypothetical protein
MRLTRAAFLKDYKDSKETPEQLEAYWQEYRADLAAEAEREEKRLAAEAEREEKRLAAEREEKRLAAEREEKRLAAEREHELAKLRIAQQRDGDGKLFVSCFAFGFPCLRLHPFSLRPHCSLSLSLVSLFTSHYSLPLSLSVLIDSPRLTIMYSPICDHTGTDSIQESFQRLSLQEEKEMFALVPESERAAAFQKLQETKGKEAEAKGKEAEAKGKEAEAKGKEAEAKGKVKVEEEKTKQLSLIPENRRGGFTKVPVRLWKGGMTKSVDAPSFEALAENVRVCFQLNVDQFRLYYIINGRDLNDGMLVVSDESSLKGYLDFYNKPTLLVYEDDHTPSDSPSLSKNSSRDYHSDEGKSAGGRNKNAQGQWAEAIRKRDGKKCIVTGQEYKFGKQDVHACHLFGVNTTTKTERDAAGILGLYDLRNGVLLAAAWHNEFDKYGWCLDDEFCVQLSSRLLDNDVFNSYQGQKVAMPEGDNRHAFPSQKIVKARFALWQSKIASTEESSGGD